MTQAFNLSQFANKLNSSGEADLNSAVNGVLPLANGGSGTSSPSLVAGTNISVTGTWPNQTINNTAPSSYVGDKGQVFTTNGTFTVPTGITAVKVTLLGGGAGGSVNVNGFQTNGGTGGTSSFGALASATGGSCSWNSGPSGGSGSGSLVITGEVTFTNNGANSNFGTGGFENNINSYGYGSAGQGAQSYGGGAGGLVYYFATGLTPGGTISITIGGAGAAGSNSQGSGGPGRAGLVMIEW